ncbi:hypothetical protein SAMN03159338_1538 [Sphingomonas sp. NFR04]|uniref:hypothetical protein n=1 Tax=Sphingomonas sp. NFR04 TaxID=1566283 RepID=UPI0008E99099|nr:hypothetical protein [Sphingomonas sp. NFR04]SFJ48893.1 hypothetical protein SAMN03159338_1538 [Sphingomonas sp. NFR04]
MKTASTYKIQRAQAAIAAGEKPAIAIRGIADLQRVSAILNKGFALELTLERNAGFLIVDPDDILAVHVRSRPTRDDS